ncbi:MAG: hypothetical protein NTU41_13610 [Chloroflexi bacterium]|nr:hypothetical protein [Chloroflexota bacterium]
MAITEEKAYYKTVRRAAAAVNGATSLKEKLDTIVRGIAGSMKAGALCWRCLTPLGKNCCIARHGGCPTSICERAGWTPGVIHKLAGLLEDEFATKL